MTPSSFRLLEPSAGPCAVAVSCPVCGSTTINLVSSSHLDVPFHSDAHGRASSPHVFADDALGTIDAFRAELDAAEIDSRRLALHGR